jgi:hypothetical protein
LIALKSVWPNRDPVPSGEPRLCEVAGRRRHHLGKPWRDFAGSGLLFSHSISIDAAGDITGTYIDQLDLQHGFLRNPYGTVTGFDPPEGGATNPTSINDGGAVTGFYQFKTGGPAVGFIRVP